MYNEDDNHSELNTQENTNIPDDKVIETIEDCYDFCQTYLKALLATVSRDSIREIWRIIPYMSSNSYQHVILLKDGTFLCTCLLLVSRGIVCRHYFKLMVEDLSVLFHVMLMPSRWFKIDFWDQFDFISKEPFIGVSSQKYEDSNMQSMQSFFPKHYNNIQEVEFRHHVQKKMEYGKFMGNFKKALNYSIDDNDQKNLNDIILSYIAKKEEKRENEALLASIESQTSNNMRLGDGRIYNVESIKDPIIHKGKGRPPAKRLKASNEENSKVNSRKILKVNNGNEVEVTGGRKCRLCQEIGHYAPKCPNKGSNKEN
ncbi:unnamed protein product [Rhizophagus irregularis]|uniref:SWIM-type domain-containing protein n=1 Tax=Rhizophagus irregularis TaxID=588596 RepID=A0A916E0M0_9GLOM|nr:unnamed protein product [Rhizophagus irregularis]